MENKEKQKHGNYLYFYCDASMSHGLLPHIAFTLSKGTIKNGIYDFHRLDGPALIVLHLHKISKYHYEYGNKIYQ